MRLPKNKNKEMKNTKADGIIVMETQDLLFLIVLKYILTKTCSRIAIDSKMKQKPTAIRDE